MVRLRTTLETLSDFFCRFEISDLKSESVDANIGALGANIKPTYELCGSVFDHTKIIFTPTSACLLFNRFDVLSKLLDNPIVFRLERQCLRRIHLKSPYNLDRAESAWALMPANPVRLAMREYSSARHTNWYDHVFSIAPRSHGCTQV